MAKRMNDLEQKPAQLRQGMMDLLAQMDALQGEIAARASDAPEGASEHEEQEQMMEDVPLDQTWCTETLAARSTLPFLLRRGRRKPGPDQLLQVGEKPGHIMHITKGKQRLRRAHTNFYEWEDVLDSRASGKVLVKWKGYSEPTWEPATEEMIEFYRAKPKNCKHQNPHQPAPTSRTGTCTPTAVATPVVAVGRSKKPVFVLKQQSTKSPSLGHKSSLCPKEGDVVDCCFLTPCGRKWERGKVSRVNDNQDAFWVAYEGEPDYEVKVGNKYSWRRVPPPLPPAPSLSTRQTLKRRFDEQEVDVDQSADSVLSEHGAKRCANTSAIPSPAEASDGELFDTIDTASIGDLVNDWSNDSGACTFVDIWESSLE